MPAQRHSSFEVLLSAGRFSINTLLEPGIQGAAVFGMHGALNLALSAPGTLIDATAGLDILPHMPKGIIFSIGVKSIIVAAGLDTVFTVDGITCKTDGISPK